MEQELRKKSWNQVRGFIHGVSLPAKGEPRQSPWGQLLGVWWPGWRSRGHVSHSSGCFLFGCTHLHTSRIPGSEEQQRKSCSGHLLCSFFFLCWGSPAPDLKRDLSLISWRITLPLPERTTSGTSEHISWLPFRAPWHLNHTECYKYRAIHVCF